MLQFPWRWQMVLAGVIAIVAAATADSWMDAATSPRARALATVLLVVVSLYLIGAAYARLPRGAAGGEEPDVSTRANVGPLARGAPLCTRKRFLIPTGSYVP